MKKKTKLTPAQKDRFDIEVVGIINQNLKLLRIKKSKASVKLALEMFIQGIKYLEKAGKEGAREADERVCL